MQKQDSTLAQGKHSSRTVTITAQKTGYAARFHAMASPCEVLIENHDKQLVEQVAHCVSNEVWRIEDKYSRYNPKSLCSQINQSHGSPIAIDEETYLLLNFAEQCYQLSGGLFDITSGVLAKVWDFSNIPSECKKLPSQADLNEVLPHVGWHKVSYDKKQLILPKHMSLDFGGIGKEYAVDRSILLVKQLTASPVLVNLGGDLAVTGPRGNDKNWQVAIENPNNNSTKDLIIALKQGALATSGDSKRYLLKEGVRYGHILNAKTGWPISQAPHSITTVAPHCIQAGILATLALLQGKAAESFLTEQEITYWTRR